jgi:hypothetical protein
MSAQQAQFSQYFSWVGRATGRQCWVVAWCFGLTVVGALPVVCGWPPEPSNLFARAPGWQFLGCLALVTVLGLLLGLVARLDAETGSGKAARHVGFTLLAALLTGLHFCTVDVLHLDWQWAQYRAVLGHFCAPPDQYRFLSQGTLWWMLQTNGSFTFSYLAYRFFFTCLLCHAIYTFARLYLRPLHAIIVVLVYAAFYRLSTRYYYGNLCDPTSHTVMLMALFFCQRRQFGAVICLVVLGTFIKETMLVIAPCWLLLGPEPPTRWRYQDMLRVAVLVVAALGVFLACRVPFHFHCDFQSLNRTSQLMVRSNFGLPHAHHTSLVPVFERYLHPVLFLFMWVPVLMWRRDLLPPGLIRTALYLAAALFATNLCFSWNYESRNFVPGLVLLVVCAVKVITAPAVAGAAAGTGSLRLRGGKLEYALAARREPAVGTSRGPVGEHTALGEHAALP